MSAFLAVIKRELGAVARDRTIVIALLIQLFIASFSSALLLGVLSVYDPDTILEYEGGAIHIGMVGPIGNPLGSLLRAHGLQTTSYPNLTDAELALFQGQLNAIIAIPAGDPKGVIEIQLYLPAHADAANSLIRMVIQEPLKQYENELRVQNGIEVRFADLNGKPATSFEFIYSVILPILMFFPAFVAGSMAIDSLTEEVENNTLQTLLSAPLSITGIVGAKITATVILALLQCLTWLGLLSLNGIVLRNAGWILLLATIVAGTTSALAAIGAVTFKDRERSQFVYSLMLLTAVAVSTLLDVSPIKTISRLAIGDYYTSGGSVMAFLVPLIALWLILLRMSRRLAA